MKRHLFWNACLAIAMSAVTTLTCRADTLLIGQVSFDASGTGNTFDLYNLTGGLSDPSGIADNVLFSGTLTVGVQGAGQQTFTFSGIDSLATGLGSPTVIELPLGDVITSATLTLSLSSSTGVSIFDGSGNLAFANLLAVPNIQLPVLTGSSSLTPCDPQGDPCSQANIYVNTVPSVSSVPEPGTLWLVVSAVGGAMTLKPKMFRA